MNALIKCLEDVRDYLDEYLPEDADDVDKLLKDYIFIVCNYYGMGHNNSVIQAKINAFTRVRDKLNIAIDELKVKSSY